GCASAAFAAQDVSPSRGDYVQAEARMAQHFPGATAIEVAQPLAEQRTDLLGAQPLLAHGHIEVLMDVAVLELLECRFRIGKAGIGEPPRANRRADQIDGLRGLRQPFAEEETIDRTED